MPRDPKPQRIVVREVEPERFGVTGAGDPSLARELGQRVVFLDSVTLS